MYLSAQFGGEAYAANYPIPAGYKLQYTSPEMGLENAWALWLDESRKVMVISIRGTTENATSWLENFYAAMVPAEGSIKLSAQDTFNYKLAAHPKAAVHVGWLLGTGFLIKDMMPQLDAAWKTGYKEVLIIGHSQGGAIAYLITSYLRHLQLDQKLSADIIFKTYCSAAPKPGNLHYAHDFEAITQYNMAFNVVNAADWVPETPFTVQTLDDMNTTNPFVGAKKQLRQQKFPNNLILSHMYGRLSHPLYRAQRRYQRNLGNRTAKMVQKNLDGYQAPEYFASNYYVRAGNSITLLPDADYFKKFPEASDGGHVFIHHFHAPYLFLANKLPDQ